MTHYHEPDHRIGRTELITAAIRGIFSGAARAFITLLIHEHTHWI